VTTWLAFSAISLLVVALVGWALPAWAARRIAGSAETRWPAVVNFRGRRVPLGLGLVWLMWAIGVAAASNLVSFASRVFVTASMSAGAAPAGWWAALGNTPFAVVVSAVPVLLTVGAVALGLADDVLGGGEKGFSGHVRALREGRLTTGMLKLLGIGMLAFVTATGIAASIADVDPMVAAATGWARGAFTVLALIAATLVIALAANLVNLTDLRPGRALKAYIPLAVIGAALSSWGFWTALKSQTASAAIGTGGQSASAAALGMPAGAQAAVWFAAVVVCLLVLLLGPVAAVWRYDLGERGMLGDAGANAMGAVAGYLLARSAPLWLLVVFAVLLLWLNLSSERVSFTSVIERVPALRWLDGLGRLPSETAGAGSGADDGARTGGSVAEGDDARRDGVS
jgi:hypothetical protein